MQPPPKVGTIHDTSFETRHRSLLCLFLHCGERAGSASWARRAKNLRMFTGVARVPHRDGSSCDLLTSKGSYDTNFNQPARPCAAVGWAILKSRFRESTTRGRFSHLSRRHDRCWYLLWEVFLVLPAFLVTHVHTYFCPQQWEILYVTSLMSYLRLILK